MTSLKVRTRVRVFGRESAWSLAPHPQGVGAGQECVVDLEIVGSQETGYHLIKSPVGFFAADDWYLTLEEVLDTGLKDFGVARDEWAVQSADEAS